MTNLEWIKQASPEDIAIEIVCYKFMDADTAKTWLNSERLENEVYDFQAILELPFFSQDLYKTVTVREFLQTLLSRFVEEREQFSTKRPFGNSDWDSDLIILFIKKHIMKGKIDQYGNIEEFNYKQFNTILKN